MDHIKIIRLTSSFDQIAHQTEDGIEYWLARELQKLLGYNEWRNFLTAIEKAKLSCENSKNPVQDHFVDVNKMIELGLL